MIRYFDGFYYSIQLLPIVSNMHITLIKFLSDLENETFKRTLLLYFINYSHSIENVVYYTYIPILYSG